jgi:hypothetical protein
MSKMDRERPMMLSLPERLRRTFYSRLLVRVPATTVATLAILPRAGS